MNQYALKTKLYSVFWLEPICFENKIIFFQNEDYALALAALLEYIQPFLTTALVY